jgi:hypothetical protein
MMRISKNLTPWLALAAVCSALAAQPVPPRNPDPLPPSPAAPASAPAANVGKLLQLDDPVPLPSPPPSLIPDDIPTGTKRPSPANPPARGKQSPAVKPQATAADLDLRIRYRKARSVAETNEKVRAAWDDSRAARTDYAKRAALKRYYELLYAKMLTVDRDIAPLVDQRRKAGIATLTQTQIAPTVPNE